jgi:hypothetical protein
LGSPITYFLRSLSGLQILKVICKSVVRILFFFPWCLNLISLRTLVDFHRSFVTVLIPLNKAELLKSTIAMSPKVYKPLLQPSTTPPVVPGHKTLCFQHRLFFFFFLFCILSTRPRRRTLLGIPVELEFEFSEFVIKIYFFEIFASILFD